MVTVTVSMGMGMVGFVSVMGVFEVTLYDSVCSMIVVLGFKIIDERDIEKPGSGICIQNWVMKFSTTSHSTTN